MSIDIHEGFNQSSEEHLQDQDQEQQVVEINKEFALDQLAEEMMYSAMKHHVMDGLVNEAVHTINQ